jgi:hypothetical protein
MQNWWFNVAVVMLWLTTMSWLVTQKVLPPLLIGEPPNYNRIIEAQTQTQPVGWYMSFNGRTLGWALSETKRQPSGLTEIHGRVHFVGLPLEEMMLGWVRAFTRLIERPIGALQMDAQSILIIDSLGSVVRFDSAVHLTPLNEVLCVHGTVEGRQLQLTIRTGGATITKEAFLPSDALLSDALSPQVQLPGLRAGQSWTVPVYSPLWPATSPLEIIHARVENLEPIFWNDGLEECWLVVYRRDSGSGTGTSQEPCGRVWVRRDGTVLRQQVSLFDSIITFDRLSDNAAVKLAEGASPQWWSMDYESQGKKKHD